MAMSQHHNCQGFLSFYWFEPFRVVRLGYYASESVRDSTKDDQVWEIGDVANWYRGEQQLFCLFHLG